MATLLKLWAWIGDGSYTVLTQRPIIQLSGTPLSPYGGGGGDASSEERLKGMCVCVLDGGYDCVRPELFPTPPLLSLSLSLSL